jgi:hypothetical protein
LQRRFDAFLRRLVGPETEFSRVSPNRLIGSISGHLLESLVDLGDFEVVEYGDRLRDRGEMKRLAETLLALAQRHLSFFAQLGCAGPARDRR